MLRLESFLPRGPTRNNNNNKQPQARPGPRGTHPSAQRGNTGEAAAQDRRLLVRLGLNRSFAT